MACYRDSFTFLYVDDVSTLQETHVWASTACCGDSFTLSVFTLFSNTLIVCYSLNIREKVLHLYKTAGKIIVLYILILGGHAVT
jgi:hypothetical protein